MSRVCFISLIHEQDRDREWIFSDQLFLVRGVEGKFCSFDQLCDKSLKVNHTYVQHSTPLEAPSRNLESPIPSIRFKEVQPVGPTCNCKSGTEVAEVWRLIYDLCHHLATI